MIWLAVILALASLGVFVVSLTLKEKSLSRVISAAFLGLSSTLAIFSCVTIVSAGYVGVPVLFGKVQNISLPAGLHFVNPFLNVVQMSIRTENYIMSATHDEGQKKGDDSITVISSNGLRMPMDVSVPYRLLESEAPWVYQNFGNDYVDKLVRPATRAALRRAATRFTDIECWSSKRDELAEKAKELLEEEMLLLIGEYGEMSPKKVLSVSQILIGNVTIPEMVKKSIEEKLTADQEQQKMQFKIMFETKEAERKAIEASGIQKFQEIVSKGINEQTLRWKGIEATLKLAQSSNTKVVIIGAGKDGMPLILGDDHK